MKYTLRTATEDSLIFRQGFVISPLNYGQKLKLSQTKSIEDTDEQKPGLSQAIKTKADDDLTRKKACDDSRMSAKPGKK